MKEELVGFARELGLRTSGSKDLLARRIVAALEGRHFTGPARSPAATTQLSASLTSATLIRRGQRCSQVLRVWFETQLGTGFRFDHHMRDHFAAADGTTTLQDALDHWYRTREAGPEQIGSQFEHNRFTRAWHAANPVGTRARLLTAWRRYREQPVDQRGRI